MDKEIKQRIENAVKAYYSGDQASEWWLDDESYEELIAESGISDEELEQIKQSVQITDKVKHNWPMGTLPKVHSLDEIQHDKTKTAIWQLKYDGCSVEIHYDSDGSIDRASTRGDYTYGENRLQLVKKLVDLGEILDDQKDLANSSVRGELLVSNENWPTIQDEYKNQRNSASGIANRKDLKHAECLTFVPYDVVNDSDGSKRALVAEYAAPMFDTYDEAVRESEMTDVPIDGLVYKEYEDADLDKQTYAVAYKFSDQTFKTHIRDVRWQMGKTGKLTPVAVFDTVFIDADVSKASLGSYDLFKKFDFHYNDEIEVKKANMIIPQVTANLGGGTKQKIEAPQYWNGKPTHVEGAHLFAENDQRWKNILWSQLSVLTGKGIGPKVMDKIVTEYGATTFYDFVQVSFLDDFYVYGMQKKSIENIRNAIRQASDADLVKFLAAMGLDSLGWKTCEKLVDKVLKDCGEEDPTLWFMQIAYPYGFAESIKGVGAKAATSFASNYDLIVENLNDWEKLFHKLPQAVRPVKKAGPEVVITGSFFHVKRNELSAMLESEGFSIGGAVTKKTKYLFAGNYGGSKRKKAEELGTRIIETKGNVKHGLEELKELSSKKN